jgi:hypothetical protein
MMAAFVPSRLHLPRPWRRGRRRGYVDGRVWRRIGGPGHVPRRRCRGRFALVGPHISRPGGVAARRADCRCRDGRSCQRKGCHRDCGGQTANKPCHCRPLAWTRCPTLGLAQLMPRTSSSVGGPAVSVGVVRFVRNQFRAAFSSFVCRTVCELLDDRCRKPTARCEVVAARG